MIVDEVYIYIYIWDGDGGGNENREKRKGLMLRLDVWCFLLFSCVNFFLYSYLPMLVALHQKTIQLAVRN